MATSDHPSDGSTDTAFSVRKSLVTPYVPYTVYVLAYTLFGVVLGSYFGSFNPWLAAGAGASIWFGLEGLHAIDLADDGVAVRLNNDIASMLGYAQLALGAGIGVLLAYSTTWFYLLLVVAGAFLGLAYNEEWFNGLLHDRDKKTGLANFGVSWGLVPFLSGYLVMQPRFEVGILFICAAIVVDAVRLNFLEGHGAIPRYEDVGIEHNRDHKSSADEARAACHTANVWMISVWVLLAVGGMLLFVV